MNFKTRITTAIATGAVLLNALAPAAFAGTTIEISGNGAGADNWVTLNQSSVQTVNQSNVANVNNNVNADAKTGGNGASFNTGGNVTVATGNATAKANVSNDLNTNVAKVDCCASGNTNVTVSGNGAYSDNGVLLGQSSVTSVAQNNVANVNNNVDADAKTGGNDAYKNTGGDVTIVTGNATADVNVSTSGNVNSAKVGGGSSNPSATFVISGNGAKSDNYITADLASITSVAQTNVANVYNDVDADAKTGGNNANFNTGGDVLVYTGDAKVEADVDNSVNFNYADVECGCTWDVKAKIEGNGAGGHHGYYGNNDENIITVNLDTVKVTGQGNLSNLNNKLDDLDAKTGYNDSDSNTGSVEGSDPAIITGDATVDSDVSNSGNVNVVGDFPLGLPDMPEVDFSFNFAAFLALFHWGV
jgi:hypothetical protein